ncbi:alpha/beta hydrolase [Companilactobacillus alimentarius]
MINNNYNIELRRLNLMKPVDIPHLKNVQMIVKDRVDSHTYDPTVWEHMKKLRKESDLVDDLSKLREGTKATGVPDILAPKVQVELKYSKKMGRNVPYLKIYRQNEKNTYQKALFYVHGGAYYGGCAKDTLPFLRLLATKFEGVIYSIDYGLAPEYPYPLGVEDCLSVLIEEANHYTQVSLGGDSAGAAIALGASQLCQNMGICSIYKHVLFYPTVVHGSDHQGPLWNDHLIPINPGQRTVLHNNYLQFKQLDKIMTKYYLNGQDYDLSSPILSPLKADPLMFKKILVLIGEFDPFRLQDEAFAQKVGIAGCEAKYIRYGGLAHAFLNYVGQVPAVEDALDECANELN